MPIESGLLKQIFIQSVRPPQIVVIEQDGMFLTGEIIKHDDIELYDGPLFVDEDEG